MDCRFLMVCSFQLKISSSWWMLASLAEWMSCLLRYFLCSCWWFSISSDSSFCWMVVSFFVWSNSFCNLFPLSVVAFINVSYFFNANLWLLFSFSYCSIVWFSLYISSFLSLIRFDWIASHFLDFLSQVSYLLLFFHLLFWFCLVFQFQFLFLKIGARGFYFLFQ